MRRVATRHLWLAPLLGVVSTLIVGWVLPTAWQSLGAPRSPGPDTWWTDGVRGGHYSRQEHPLVESVDFRRIVFDGAAGQQPFFNRNRPPAWAAVVSLDQREGFEEVVTTATGWPWRAFRSEWWVDWTPAPPPPAPISIPGLTLTPPPAPAPFVNRGGLVLGKGLPVVPLLPIWTGLLADAAVFAGAWAVVLLSATGARRVIRRQRGRCAVCGYAREGLAAGAACPECGAGSKE